MIHIDVCTDPTERDNPKFDYPRMLVQTSRDGAGWMTQYVIAAQIDDVQRSSRDLAIERQREEAKNVARIFANGCRYALLTEGEEVRTTAFGYAL